MYDCSWPTLALYTIVWLGLCVCEATVSCNLMNTHRPTRLPKSLGVGKETPYSNLLLVFTFLMQIIFYFCFILLSCAVYCSYFFWSLPQSFYTIKR